MDLRPEAIWLSNPSADSIVAGLEADEYSIAGLQPIIGTQVTQCDIECATPCLPQTYELVFTTVNFGSCNECGKAVGFQMKLRREANFDNQDYLHLLSSLEVMYEPVNVPSGDVTPQMFRDYFVNFFDNNAYDDEHDFFGVTVVAHPTATDTLIMTVPCPLKLDLFVAPDAEANITITETDAGQTAKLTKEILQKEYPLIIGYVPGQGPDETFTGCQDICVICIKGCIPSCVSDAQNLLTTNNASHLHAVGTNFSYKIFVNSSAPGYPDFITALNAAVGACTLTAEVGSQSPIVQVTGTAGTDTLDLTQFMSATAGEFALGDGPITGVVSNGQVSISFNLTVPPLTAPIDTADLIAQLNTKFGASAFSVNAGDANIIDVAPTFSVNGQQLSIRFTSV